MEKLRKPKAYKKTLPVMIQGEHVDKLVSQDLSAIANKMQKKRSGVLKFALSDFKLKYFLDEVKVFVNPKGTKTEALVK